MVCSLPSWSGASGWDALGCASPAEILGLRFTALGDLCPGGWVYTGTGAGWDGATAFLFDWTDASVLAAVVVITGAPTSRYPFSFDRPVGLTIGHDYVVAVNKISTSCYAGNSDNAPPSASSLWTFQDYVYSVGVGVCPSASLGARVGVEPQVCDAAGYSPATSGSVSALADSMADCCAKIDLILASVRKTYG